MQYSSINRVINDTQEFQTYLLAWKLGQIRIFNLLDSLSICVIKATLCHQIRKKLHFSVSNADLCQLELSNFP